jgi:outer membrane protein
VGNIDTHVDQLGARSASLKALVKSIDAARKNLKQQKAGHYPIVDLQFSKQETNIGFENSASATTDTEVVSVNLSMPIFTGGATSAKIYEAAQQLKMAKASYDQEHRRLKKELKDEYLNVRSIKRRMAATVKSVESAEKSYQSIEKSFKYGVATISEVLDAQQLYLQVKQSFQQAEYDYVISKARFLYKAGLLTDSSLDELNKQLAKVG